MGAGAVEVVGVDDPPPPTTEMLPLPMPMERLGARPMAPPLMLYPLGCGELRSMYAWSAFGSEASDMVVVADGCLLLTGRSCRRG